MPVPPFGFSVGDFVAGASLIADIVRSLNDVKGSKSEYRALSETLQSLNQALTISHIVYLQWDTVVTHPQYGNNASTLLKGMGEARQKCLDLMQTFLNKTGHYDDAFIQERGNRASRDFKKVAWLFKKGDVKALREELSIQLQVLQEFTNAFFHNHLGAHTQDMHSAMGIMMASVSELKENVNTLSRGIQGSSQSIPAGLGYAWGTSPTLTENVLLLDATGRSLLLPMPFMTSPMLLHDLLSIMYRGLPGHQKITRREYIIADEDRDGALIDPVDWSSIIHPGMQISLNVVFNASSSWKTQCCPRCNQPSIGPTLPGKRKRCHKCQLTFSLFEKERIVDESLLSEAAGRIEAETPNANPAPIHHTLSTSSRKGHDAPREDYYFSRVHYHREILKARPVKVPDPGKEENTPMLQVNELPSLHKAAAKGDLAGINALLAAGEDINAPLQFERALNLASNRKWFFKGSSPLHLASWFAKSRAIRLLVENGANLFSGDAGSAGVLDCAICSGNHGSIAVLLELGVPVNARDQYDKTPLHSACEYATPLLVSLLLEKGADVTAQTIQGLTPLHRAAITGNTEVVKVLFEYGANINVRDSNGDSPLHSAAYNGHRDALHALLENRADTTLENNSGWTPMHAAAQYGCDAIVQELVTHGVNVDIKTRDGSSSLHIASWNGQRNTVQFLLAHGADVKSKDKKGRIPLHDAAQGGHTDVVEELVKNGSKIHVYNLSMWTPLSLASFEGRLDVAKALIEHGADVSSDIKDGNSPLHVAARYGHLPIVQHLLGDVTYLNSRNSNGRTAVLSACFGGHLSIFQFLLEKGADIHLLDDGGSSPLHIAAYMGHDNILQILLELGSDVSLQRKDGTTAVWWASNQGHLSTIKILLQHGAEANSQDQEKESAIHAGIWSAKSTEVVRALLDAGCDPYLQNINGETALEVCLRKNFGEMARLLAEYMLRDEEAFSKLTSKLTSKASKAWLSGIREQHQTTVAWKTPSPDPRADQKIDEL